MTLCVVVDLLVLREVTGRHLQMQGTPVSEKVMIFVMENMKALIIHLTVEKKLYLMHLSVRVILMVVIVVHEDPTGIPLVL
jgi:hypothetical protein